MLKTWLMETLKPEVSCYRANFARALAESKMARKSNNTKKNPLDHNNIPPHLKDMWDVFLGFSELEL